MNLQRNFAVIVPMANEERDFEPFVAEVGRVLDVMGSGMVYHIINTASRDRTLELSRELSLRDPRFITVFAPENRHLPDAYISGLRAAYNAGHEYIIEMDAGLSHDPKQLSDFIKALEGGYSCVFGSRIIQGGTIKNSSINRRLLSQVGTILSNVLLGTKLYDMTSGYQGFHRDIVAKVIEYDLKSTAHFYQTEVRYLLRNANWLEIPIQYQSPSPRVSRKAIQNAYESLLYYFLCRIAGNEKEITR
jgi:dolichol-phosphate mannosyltransferase